MAKRKTDSEFKSEVFNLVGNEYTFLDEYINKSTKLLVKHNECGNTYKVMPSSFLKGTRCKKCVSEIVGKNNTKPLSYILEKLHEVHGNEYTIIGEYKNYNTKVLVKHNKCGDTYLVRPDSLLRGSKCLKCTHKTYKKTYLKTTKDFGNEVYKTTKGKYELKLEYKGTYEPIKIKHLECGNTYKTKPYKFVLGSRCPICNHSKGETLVENILLDLNLEFERQKTFRTLKNKNNLYYDFYLPNQNLLIEYQGIQHYEPREIFGGVDSFNIQVKNDNIKRKYAKDNNYNLLEISYKVDKYNSIKEVIEKKLVNVVTQSTTNQT